MEKISFEEARRGWRRFPRPIRKSVEQNQIESVPIEQAESRALGLAPLYKTAERMFYEHPVNKQAVKELSFRQGNRPEDK